MMNSARLDGVTRFLVVVAVLLAVCGACSRTPRNVAQVKGKITLGGKAVSGALIEFSPVKGGSPSAGRSDANGEYVLVYTRRAKGAEIGEHIVSISTTPETIPFKYREGPDQPKAEVKRGQNTLDFSLEPGPIHAPQPKVKAKGKRSGV
jgi:hypothetical protein